MNRKSSENKHGKLLYDPNQRINERLGAFSSETNNDEDIDDELEQEEKENVDELANDEETNESLANEGATPNTGSAIKSVASQKTVQIAGKIGSKIVTFIAANPWVLLVIAIAVILVIVILFLVSAFGGADSGYYNEECNFNLTNVTLKTCDTEEVSALSIKEYVFGATYYISKNNDYNDEILKSLMIIQKTNALSIGNYNNTNKNISLDTCNVGFEKDIPSDILTKYEELYTEIENYLYLPDSFTGTITSLDSDISLSIPNDLNSLDLSNFNNYGDILNYLFNSQNESNINEVENEDDTETSKYSLYNLSTYCEYIESENNYSETCEEFSIKFTTLSRDEFIAKIKNHFANKSGSYATEFINHAGDIYDISVQNDINPEVLVTRAEVEGYSPGDAYNYYGMGCTNTGHGKDCKRYSSFVEGVRAFVDNISQYNTLADMMGRYAYLGDNWYNPGSWSQGGCAYFPYIKQYMSDTRVSQVTNYCSSSKTCYGSSCALTTDEDKYAYKLYQVHDKMIPYRQNIFNLSSEECKANETGSNYIGTEHDTPGCTLYRQGDSRWASIKLGSSGLNMGNSGCAVTAIATGITCAGVKTNIDNFNAGTFVNALNKNGCFDSSGNFSWSCVQTVAPSLSVASDQKVASKSVQDKKNILNSFDLSNHFVLIKISNSKYSTHYLLYQSISGDDVIVKDPADGKVNKYSFNDVVRYISYRFK